MFLSICVVHNSDSIVVEIVTKNISLIKQEKAKKHLIYWQFLNFLKIITCMPSKQYTDNQYDLACLVWANWDGFTFPKQNLQIVVFSLSTLGLLGQNPTGVITMFN